MSLVAGVRLCMCVSSLIWVSVSVPPWVSRVCLVVGGMQLGGGRKCVSVFVGILLYMKHFWARQVLTPTLSRSGDRKAEKGKWGKEEKWRERKRGEERAREKE